MRSVSSRTKGMTAFLIVTNPIMSAFGGAPEEYHSRLEAYDSLCGVNDRLVKLHPTGSVSANFATWNSCGHRLYVRITEAERHSAHSGGHGDAQSRTSARVLPRFVTHSMGIIFGEGGHLRRPISSLAESLQESAGGLGIGRNCIVFACASDGRDAAVIRRVADSYQLWHQEADRDAEKGIWAAGLPLDAPF